MPCPYGFFMEFRKQSIKTSVVACIVDGDGRVLLTRRCVHPFCGQWVMPGGGVPPCLYSGRHVVQILCHRDGKPFSTSVP